MGASETKPASVTAVPAKSSQRKFAASGTSLASAKSPKFVPAMLALHWSHGSLGESAVIGTFRSSDKPDAADRISLRGFGTTALATDWVRPKRLARMR